MIKGLYNMTESEEKFASEIKAYLDNRVEETDTGLLGTRTDLTLKQRVKQGAMLLLRFAPARYKFRAQQCIEAPLPYRVKEMNEALEKVYREVTKFGSLDKMVAAKAEMVAKAKTAVNKLEHGLDPNDPSPIQTVSDNDTPVIGNVNKGVAKQGGKRADHDQLPRRIQALYEDNLNVLQAQRAAHEKAKILVAQVEKMIERDAPICDIEEACNAIEATTKEIMDRNVQRMYNWRMYDEFDPTDKSQNEENHSVVVPLADQTNEALFKYLRKGSERLVKFYNVPDKKQFYEEAKEGIKLRLEEMKRRGLKLPADSVIVKRLREAEYFSE